MKVIKIVGVVLLFGIVIYLAMGLKKRIVQQTCDSLGNYNSTSGEEVMGSENEKAWYCCPTNKDKMIDNCSFYGD